jgi:hypothetical protein
MQSGISADKIDKENTRTTTFYHHVNNGICIGHEIRCFCRIPKANKFTQLKNIVSHDPSQ